jgi:hypothetical protein
VETRTAEDHAEPSAREEAAMYLIVATALIVLGALVLTPLLNWICGPAFVVGGVAGLDSLRRRRHARVDK